MRLAHCGHARGWVVQGPGGPSSRDLEDGMEVPIVHSALIGQRLEFAEDYNAAKKNYWKVCDRP